MNVPSWIQLSPKLFSFLALIFFQRLLIWIFMSSRWRCLLTIQWRRLSHEYWAAGLRRARIRGNSSAGDGVRRHRAFCIGLRHSSRVIQFTGVTNMMATSRARVPPFSLWPTSGGSIICLRVWVCLTPGWRGTDTTVWRSVCQVLRASCCLFFLHHRAASRAGPSIRAGASLAAGWGCFLGLNPLPVDAAGHTKRLFIYRALFLYKSLRFCITSSFKLHPACYYWCASTILRISAKSKTRARTFLILQPKCLCVCIVITQQCLCAHTLVCVHIHACSCSCRSVSLVYLLSCRYGLYNSSSILHKSRCFIVFIRVCRVNCCHIRVCVIPNRVRHCFCWHWFGWLLLFRPLIFPNIYITIKCISKRASSIKNMFLFSDFKAVLCFVFLWDQK